MTKKIFLTIAFIMILALPSCAFDIQNNPYDILGINTSSEMQQYLIPVGKKIISNFELPDTNENYSTIVKFKIDQKGKLSNLEIVQESGNKDYDNRVLSAIKKSAPFPAHSFDETESECFILNMDLGIIKLIKMLLELDSNLMNFDFNKLMQSEKPTSKQQKPTGKKFINPNELEKSLE